MAWCMRCAAKGGHVKAAVVYDDEDLCAFHEKEARKENDDPLPPPVPLVTRPKAYFGRWDDALRKLKGMEVGDELRLTPDIDDMRKYSNQLRSMLHARKMFGEFTWSINYHDGGQQVIVTKESKLDQEIELGLKAGKSVVDVARDLKVTQAKVAAVQSSIKEFSSEAEANVALDRGEGGTSPDVSIEKTRTVERLEKVTESESISLQDHTQHVQRFLSDMYATMIDPIEQPEMNVARMCELLLKTAREQRDQLAATNGAGNGAGHILGDFEGASYETKLKSGGILSVHFMGELFRLSPADRAFVLGIIDRMKFYQEFGSPDVAGPEKPGLPRVSGKGEKLVPMLVPISWLNDMMEMMDEEDRAAAVAAWFRSDPAVAPVR